MAQRAVPAFKQAGGNGTLTQDGIPNTYILDLGSINQFHAPLIVDIAALNAATDPAADVLNGYYGIAGDGEFADIGFAPFSNLGSGEAADSNEIVLNTGTIGTFTQQIVLIDADDPRLSNGLHAYEAGDDLRWTDGEGILDARLFEGFTGRVEMVLHVACATNYPAPGLVHQFAA